MNGNYTRIRVLAAAGAIAIVTLAIAGFGGYSHARFESAFAAANGPQAAPPPQFTLELARVDVVAPRLARTRTTANTAAVRPQS